MTTRTNSAHAEIRHLQRQVRGLQTLAAAAILAIPLLAWIGGPTDVLRVRGIVIEDAEGRERILIGAPIPEVAHRIRTDFEKAEAAWGERFPDMEWYRKLDHDTVGMLVLDENGHDRIAIGDPTPDPNVGRRIAPSVGIAINDAEGFERSGWGHFPELGRVGFGLDRQDGEGLNLFILEDGTSGVLIRDKDGEHHTFLGHASPESFVTSHSDSLHGLVLRDASGPRVLIDGASETPEIELHDRAADQVRKLGEK